MNMVQVWRDMPVGPLQMIALTESNGVIGDCRGGSREKKRRHKHKRVESRAPGRDQEGLKRAEHGRGSGRAGAHKKHDWGFDREEEVLGAPSNGQSTVKDQPKSSVAVSEVPDALRARIKAMLAQT